MPISDVSHAPRNTLHSLVAVGGVLLGVFLLAGAYGHFAAIWPTLGDAARASLGERFGLLKPGLILLAAGLVDIGVCQALWKARNWALQLALAVNVVVMIYLGWLLAKGVPGHPIGLFLGLVSSYVVLLLAIRAGLVWPTPASSAR